MRDDAGILPAGGKIAKITKPALADVHRAVGDEFRLWDGSSSLIQAAVDPVQADLDALPDRTARTAELMRRAAVCV